MRTGWLFALVLTVVIVTTGCAGLPAASSPATPIVSSFCERSKPLTASQQDRLLRFAAVVREELAVADGDVVLLSRSGLDLSRFDIRYSHAAVAWRAENGTWSARQLYYACDEGRSRIYDQGLAGFVMGIDDASLGYISVVKLPSNAARELRLAALDTPRVLRLLAASYSANAYAFGLRYQNCNQWVMELLAMAWGDLADGDDLRERAQIWLRQEHYFPQPVDIDSHWLMLASAFVPLVHLSDHPEEDRLAMRLQVSLPESVETFIRGRFPSSERAEICHDGEKVVVRHGWTPIANGCQPGIGDRTVVLDG